MGTFDILRDTRALLSDESRWTKLQSAADPYGHTESIWITAEGKPQQLLPNPKATCWCLTGAIEFCQGPDAPLNLQVFQLLAQALPQEETGDIELASCTPSGHFMLLASYNDDPETKHADILALLDRAIVSAQEATP